MTNRRYAMTNGCSPQEVTAVKSRKFCEGFNHLNGEFETAKEADDLRNELGSVTSKIDGMNLSKVMRAGDPQSEALARLTGSTPEAIRTYLAVLVALLLELGSGLGLWVVSGNRERSGNKNNELAGKSGGGDAVKEFAKNQLAYRHKGEVSARELYASFTSWCLSRNRVLVNTTQFGRGLTNLGYKRVKRGGKIRYIEVYLSR